MFKYTLILGLIWVSSTWRYDDQENWVETCDTTKYRHQSPIEINCINDLTESKIRYILEYSYYDPILPPRLTSNGKNLVVIFHLPI